MKVFAIEYNQHCKQTVKHLMFDKQIIRRIADRMVISFCTRPSSKCPSCCKILLTKESLCYALNMRDYTNIEPYRHFLQMINYAILQSNELQYFKTMRCCKIFLVLYFLGYCKIFSQHIISCTFNFRHQKHSFVLKFQYLYLSNDNNNYVNLHKILSL